MTQFILNNQLVKTHLPPGTLLLDYIRYHQHLTGTKIGCREGDCGACTVLIGDLQDGEVKYASATSCLTAIGNVCNKHIVTIEGLNKAEGLTPVQQAMADEAATQCGFCTPGFVVSITGFCLGDKAPDYQNAVAAVDGNICRCTGYKSIERALRQLTILLQQREAIAAADFAMAHEIIPSYFSEIKSQLQALLTESSGLRIPDPERNDKMPVTKKPPRHLGGGTDLYVQRPEEMEHSDIDFLTANQALKAVTLRDGICTIGGAVTVAGLVQSSFFQQAFSRHGELTKLISSTPIRNIATIAGNFVNASPIGDFSVFFLALNASVILSNGTQQREVSLRRFFKGYKTLDKSEDEAIEKIIFRLPSTDSLFNFEKICKRKYLDIATVNTAIHIKINDDETIAEASVSAGGVAAVPLFLSKTSAFLKDRMLSETTVQQAAAITIEEVSPISDVRGTADYKRLLLGQLIKAHFITLFPKLHVERLLTSL